MPDGTALIDVHGVMRFVNDQLSQLTGYSREELVGQNVQMLIPPRLSQLEDEARSVYARDPGSRIIWNDRDLTVLRKDGTELPVDFALSPLTVDAKLWMIGSIRDNSTQRRAEQAREEAEQHFRLAFEDNMAPMVFTNLEDKIFAANDAFYSMVGRTPQEIIGFDSKLFTHPDDVGITEGSHEQIIRGEVGHVRYVKRYLHKDGRMIYAEVSKTPARDESGNTLYFIISERDITEERLLTDQLSHQALHDSMTGLANRALFEDRLTQAQSRVQRQGGRSALLLIDLDDFKRVNDTHGHLTGDDVLVEVARRLQAVTRSSDTLSRFGGDEFLYLAEDVTDVAEAEDIAVRLVDALASPLVVGSVIVEQRASVGVVVWGKESETSVDLVRDADVALYEAKRLGKGRHVIHSAGMHQQAAAHDTISEQLRRAVSLGDLAMHYQPIVHLMTGRVVGFEALMRWCHPERGWVPPNVFIPLAEQSDLIVDIGAFALHEAISAATTWQRIVDSIDEPYVTVNLSARQFHDASLVAMIEAELETSGLAPDRLIIEITESVALLEVSDTLNMIARLRHLGIGVALDDFGTGFSSLAYLARLDPIIIKVDQSFVRQSNESLRHDRLLETIVSLGNNLGVTVLAEGIETPAQLNRLQRYACSLGQGLLFSPAVPSDETRSLVGSQFDV